jgi:glycerol-3-phosphate O-acyltransferase
MAKNSIPNDYANLLPEDAIVPANIKDCLLNFLAELPSDIPSNVLGPLLKTFIGLVFKQLDHPFKFSSHHVKVRVPFDYYRFGLDFIRPFVDSNHSKILGVNQLEKIKEQLTLGHNVVFLANHQSELDPQAISLLLEQNYPDIAEGITYIAGERVVTDPLAIPFSMGMDLLCIYSKRYAQTSEKLLHNKQTMTKLSLLFREGKKIIYVAPSGGRDRKNENGRILPAALDPNSIEMMSLMSKKGGVPTHFYPLALSTYDLLPPPDTIQKELGEKRVMKFTPIRLNFGSEINMDQFEGETKEEKRNNKADKIWNMLLSLYLEATVFN